LNKYQYCLNNPLRYIDPDGHDPEDGDDGVVSGAISFLKGVGSGAASVVVGTAKLVKDSIVGCASCVADNLINQAKSIGSTLKADFDLATHPKEAAAAISSAIKEGGTDSALNIVGNATGQVLASAAIAKGLKAGIVEVEARASILPRVEAAAKLGGNQPVGSVISATRSGAERAGSIWTGSGARPLVGRQGSTVPGSFNPATGRSFRPPTAKPYGGTVANFQTRSPKANVHVNVKWSFF